MSKKNILRVTSIAAFGLIFCLFGMNRSQTYGLSIGHQDKPAEQVYKNVQSLKGMSVSQLDGVMVFMSASLGVGCNYCHTDSWESDDRAAKQNARRMIEMTRNINKTNYGVDWGVVTCYTCHAGKPHPETMPGAMQSAWQSPDAKPAGAATAMPALDDVLDKHARAIGGQIAIDKLKTRISKGSLTVDNWMAPRLTVPLEIHQKAPDRLFLKAEYPDGNYYEGFDGSTAWAIDNSKRPYIKGEKPEQLEADFYGYLKLRDRYPTMRLLGKERINDREAFVIGATSREGSRDRLYLDVETLLLVRKQTVFRTALGMIPEVTDFADYRTVDGVKLPFRIIWSRPPFTRTRTFTEINHNVSIDDAKFTERASKR